jgi:hypothetical protein
MHSNQNLEELKKSIEGRCIRTYLDVLGYHPVEECGNMLVYDPIPPRCGILHVFYPDNCYIDLDTWRIRKRPGNVLDLAALIHGTTVDQVLQDFRRYKLDLLLKTCGECTGPLWLPAQPEPEYPETSDYMPY